MFDETIKLANNAMLKHRPDLFYEWDFEKNDELRLDIYKVTYGNSNRVWWYCPDCKSKYDNTINSRAGKNKTNCPYCSGKRVNHTNSLATLRPDLLSEWNATLNDRIKPSQVTVGSGEKAWWTCLDCNSNYDMQIYRKSISGNGCPYCDGKKVNETNSLSSIFPEISLEWNYNKNTSTPEEIVIGSHKKIWWICHKEHEWEARVYSRTGKNKSGCPYCSGKYTCEDNSLVTTHPDIAKEWSYKLNKHTPFEVTFGSPEKVWWSCLNCDSDYEAMISNRTRLNSSCPYCANQKTNHTNSLAVINPDIASDWHPTKNEELTPDDKTSGSNQKVWWLGKCGHEWDALISDRTGRENQGCPICSGHRVEKGFNDLWTTNPEIARLLVKPEIGYSYSKGSNYKTDWKCPSCESILENKMITAVNRSGLCCPGCSDGVSFGEKFIYHLLRDSEIEFDYEKIFPWSNRKRYDFYLPELNWIIEVHGIQHYETSPFHKNGETLEKIQANDLWKYNTAMKNGIKKYIVVDARFSEMSHISHSVESSDLKELLGNVDYEQLGRKSYNSFLIDACNLWKSGLRSTLKISQEMKIYRYTVTQYLKRGAEVGLCDYDPKVESQNSWKHVNKRHGRAIVQLRNCRGYIRSFVSFIEAVSQTGVSRELIVECCKGKRETAGGFKWMYKEDYEKELGEIEI